MPLPTILENRAFDDYVIDMPVLEERSKIPPVHTILGMVLSIVSIISFLVCIIVEEYIIAVVFAGCIWVTLTTTFVVCK